MPKCLKIWLVSILLLFGGAAHAQQLTGVWTGKISRALGSRRGVESIEIMLEQQGKHLFGYAFAFKDTSRFVLYRLQGRRNRKTKEVFLEEVGTPNYDLPQAFYPCRKQYILRYHKVGRTRYLTGTWQGEGAFADTSCFPGEELLIGLQQIPRPEYPLEAFVARKFLNYYNRPRSPRKPSSSDSLNMVRQEELVETPPTGIAGVNFPAPRKLDIQDVLAISDTLVRLRLYDNATIDGDSVSIFINKTPVLRQHRLATDPWTYQFVVSRNTPTEILLQAENLGEIPPNTALLVVEVGQKRFEVRLSATLETHAVVLLEPQR